MRKSVLLILGIWSFAMTTQAQLTVGANAGLMSYYGDASEAGAFSFTLPSTGLSGGLFLEKPINRFFIPQLQLSYGLINGQKDYLNVTAEGNVIDVALKLQLDVMEMLKPESKIQVAPFLGAGLGLYNSDVLISGTSALVDADHVNNETGMGNALALHFGGRIGYEISPQLTLLGSMDIRSFLSDELDDYRGLESRDGLGGNDWTNFLSLGVSYTFSPKEDELYEEPEPLIVEEKSPDEMVNGVFTYNNLPKSGVKLNLYDATNNKVASTITDINGEFKFENLSPEENYAVKLSEEDKGLFNAGKLYVINSEGNRVASADKPEFNAFTFTQLTEEQVEELPTLVENLPSTEMSGVYVYEELPKGGVKIYLMDESNNPIDSAITRADGTFKFSKLSPNANYGLQLASEDQGEFKGGDIFFNNEEGEPEVRAASEGENGYSFKAMEEEEMAELMVLTPEDGGLLYRKITEKEPVVEEEPKEDVAVKEEKTVKEEKIDTKYAGNVNFEKETIYFRHNSFWISQNQQGTKGSIIAKKLKANPDMRIRIEGWSSKPGTDEYNLVLSQKRADALKKLLVETHGVKASRIEAVGKGEIKDNTPESEARRARIYVIK